MAALYADEDFPGPVVALLRGLGHDVLTAGDDGRGGQGIDDPDVLARATALGRAVVTHNRVDYHRLHAANPNHGGIVTCTRDQRWQALANRIDVAITVFPSLAGRLVKVIRPNVPRLP